MSTTLVLRVSGQFSLKVMPSISTFAPLILRSCCINSFTTLLAMKSARRGNICARQRAPLNRAKRPTLAVGFAFAAQEMDAVPIDQFDQRLDAVVTETGVRLFGGGTGGR